MKCYEIFMPESELLKGFPKNIPHGRTVIWGASDICRRLLDCCGHPKTGLEIWDTYKAGHMFAGYEIKAPELTASEDGALDALVIMAFTEERNLEVCSKLLLKAGYKNIIDGSKLLDLLISNRFKADYYKYKELNTDDNFMMDDQNLQFEHEHIYNFAGSNFNECFLLQDLWAAKKIYEKKPSVHYDIGSRVDGFITHILSFNTKTVLVDIRKLDTHGTENLTFINEDATLLSGIEDNSIESISALGSLEHFGLGKYGDPIDPDAHIKAFKSIQRVLKKGGDFYMSVPVSKSCGLVFNSKRVYSPQYLIECFSSMELAEFSHTTPKGLAKDVSITSFSGEYCWGFFHFRKK